jgi:hypothetical protein
MVQTITKEIDVFIQTFIKQVSNKYKIDSGELKSMWNGDEITQNIKESIRPKEIDYETLLKCNKAELIAHCKSFGHKCSGPKNILINRLLGKEDVPSNDVKVIDSKKSKSTKSSQKEAVKQTSVVKTLTANIPDVVIRRNQYDKYEHPETGLIFDNESKLVIGKQNDNGSVDPLTEEDIDMCNAFKFKFTIPLDLDSKSTLVDVKVDELEEDEELEIEDDDVEEEEEEEEELLEEDLIDEEEEDEEEEYESD